MAEGLGALARRLRKERGLTQGQVATYASLDRSWISVLETGGIERPDPDKLKRLASVLHVPADTLLAAAGYNVTPLPVRERTAEEAMAEAMALLRREREEAERRAEQDRRIAEAVRPTIMVPLVSGVISAGPGAIVDTVPYLPREQEESHRFVAVQVRGDCMEPLVMNGHVVIVDTDASPHPGDIVAADHDGEVMIKLLEDRDGVPYLTAKQGEPPRKVNGGTRIIGVVVQAQYRPGR